MSSVTAHQICNTAIAQSSAQLILQRNLYIRNKYTFTLPINYILLEPTDYVTLDDAVLGLYSHPVRILTIEESGDEFMVTAEDAPAGISSHAIYGTQIGFGGGVNDRIQPGNTAAPYIFVPPTVLTATGGVEIWIGACGVTQATWGGCEVWVSYDDVSYQTAGVIDGPSRVGTLIAPLAAGSDPDVTNTLAVSIGSGQDLGSATTAEWNNYATLSIVDGEFIAYQTATLTGAGRYSLSTLHRGLYGSTIGAHASGANFTRVDSSLFKLHVTPDKIGSTIYIKLPAFNQFGKSTQLLSACTASIFTIGINQVPALTGITLAPIFGGFLLKYTKPSQADFGGVNVYVSATSGFTPTSGNLVYSGPDTMVTISTDASGNPFLGGTTYYVRVSGYTTTSKTGMSYSTQLSVIPGVASVIVPVLTNDSSTIPATYAGVAETYAGCSTQITIYNGVTDDSGNWTYLQARSAGLTVTEPTSSRVATVTGMDAAVDSATITFTASRAGYASVQKVFSISKSKDGHTIIEAIESTNGGIFRQGQARSTMLIARVYANGLEITDTVNESLFRWRRVSFIPNPAGDAAWNALYATGYKQISLTVTDVTDEATFYCDISK